MTREYVEKRMRDEKCGYFEGAEVLCVRDAVDVAMELVSEMAARDEALARSWETTVLAKNGVVEAEATFMCNDVARNMADAIRGAARKPEREGGGMSEPIVVEHVPGCECYELNNYTDPRCLEAWEKAVDSTADERETQ